VNECALNIGLMIEKNPVPGPRCPLQVTHGMAWVWTQDNARSGYGSNYFLLRGQNED